MQRFQRVKRENLAQLAPYFAVQNTHVSDFSVGFQFMWQEQLKSEFAVVKNCLVLKEVYEGNVYFHYPLSLTGSVEEELSAVAELESLCRAQEVRLHFTNVPRSRVSALALRYATALRVTNARRWRDYLYRVEDFQRYAGGRYSGQRNHVNKFLKNYPEWSFRAYRAEDEGQVREFLAEYAASQLQKNSELAAEELRETCALLPHLEEFNMACGLLFVGERLVGFSVGERCGDMLVVHIEKALRTFEGAYPFLAQRFARTFCGEGIAYLNRMDDAGDAGLRKSKLQYLPCEIVDKYNLFPERAIDGVEELPEFFTERLKIGAITDEYALEFARLAADTVRNEWWGYDYRADYAGEGVPPAEWFLAGIREDFANRNELSLGIYLGEKLIGEVVLHHFGYAQEAEIGARLLPEYVGRGYASEAIRATARFATIELGLERVEAKCFRQNERSRRMLLSAGFRPQGEDETYFYFYKTPAC